MFWAYSTLTWSVLWHGPYCDMLRSKFVPICTCKVTHFYIQIKKRFLHAKGHILTCIKVILLYIYSAPLIHAYTEIPLIHTHTETNTIVKWLIHTCERPWRTIRVIRATRLIQMWQDWFTHMYTYEIASVHMRDSDIAPLHTCNTCQSSDTLSTETLSTETLSNYGTTPHLWNIE